MRCEIGDMGCGKKKKTKRMKQIGVMEGCLTGCTLHVVRFPFRRAGRFKFTAEAQSKPILNIMNKLKAYPEQAEKCSVQKKGATVVFLPFKTFAYFASLRLEKSLNVEFGQLRISQSCILDLASCFYSYF